MKIYLHPCSIRLEKQKVDFSRQDLLMSYGIDGDEYTVLYDHVSRMEVRPGWHLYPTLSTMYGMTSRDCFLGTMNLLKGRHADVMLRGLGYNKVGEGCYAKVGGDDHWYLAKVRKDETPEFGDIYVVIGWCKRILPEG